MQTVKIILNFLRVLRSTGRASKSGNALPARSLNSLGYQPTVPGEGCPNVRPSAGAFEPGIEPHALIYLFSISTGSASGGCTFTFTSAMRGQFPPLGARDTQSSQTASWRIEELAQTVPVRGEGPSFSCRSRSFLVCRLEVARMRLLRLTRRTCYILFLFSRISVAVGQTMLVPSF